MEAFMKVTRKGCSNISHTLLTPPDKLHDKQRMNNSKGQKKPKIQGLVSVYGV
jgi:hypothetical protein